MSEQRSLLEHLSVEVFRLIFEYLAPHDLLFAFENLNQRFMAILAQQPLGLPNNRHMSFDIYLDYLTSILPDHASQIVYLHLSERRAPHAMHLFLSEVPIDKLVWSALKAITIEDVPRDIFEWLLNDSSLLSNIQSLSIDLDHDCYHYSEYDDLIDSDIVVPLLNELRELRSLRLRISTIYAMDYALDLAKTCPRIITHTNLHILSIVLCSRQLLVKLLDNGHLPKLRRLRVHFSEENLSQDGSIRPTPLKQTYVPELREVNIGLHDGVGWIFTYLEEIHSHSQLEHLNVCGYLSFSPISDIPRVPELRRWLTLSKSINFTFRLQLWMHCLPENYESREKFLEEYMQATGHDSVGNDGNLSIRYPAMSLSGDNMSISDTDSDGSSDFLDEKLVDNNVEEMDIIDLNYMGGDQVEETRAVPRWHRLSKIRILGDHPNENNAVDGNISYLLEIARRSPHFRELHIEANLDFSRMLSSNVELGILLATQLEVLRFSGIKANCSLLDLARIIDTLFAHSSSSPVLRKLILNVDAHPSSWLSVRHLVDGIGKILDRFPALIHFTLYCQPVAAYRESIYSLSELASKWYVRSMRSLPMMTDSLKYRHTPNSLDIWL